jgi:hypothetical protein
VNCPWYKKSESYSEGYEQGKKDTLSEVLKDIKEMEHFADDVDNCLLISYHEVIDKLEQKIKAME